MSDQVRTAAATGARYALGIVHYRDPDSVTQLVRAAASWTVTPALILVVDNSGDLTTAENAPGLPVRVIRPGSNVGYAAAANRLIAAARAADHHHLLLATQDCELAADTAELLFAAADPQVGVAVAAPELYLRACPGSVFSLGGVITAWSRTLHLGQGRPRPPGAPSGIHDVDWADGCCLMLDTGFAHALGGFDERFFLYVEEVDFQYRTRLSGRRVVVVPRAKASQQPGNYTLYYKYRNLMLWTSKYPALRRWPWLLALPKDSIRMLRLGRITQPGWAVRGLLDAARGRFGPAPTRIWKS